ncbi:MAG: SMP-30/gluconolactonase/LRE family protein, partial [Actinomycetota bacterium]
ATLGEGPVWRAETGEVIWVDILDGLIHATTLDGTTRLLRRHAVPVGAVVLNPDGDVLASTPVGLVDDVGTIVAPLAMTAPDVRANDGKADPAGRFVSGTMTVGDARQGAGALWSIAAPGVELLVAEATIANGLAWSADGATLYWIDTPTGRVDAFDYDLERGTVENRRPHVVAEDSWGSPDGMSIDDDDRLWVAFWGGQAVRCFDGSTCVEVVEVPTPLVTCPTFAGPDLDQLVITTASVDVAPGTPGAGDLYVVSPGCRGRDPHRIGAWGS